MISRRQFVAAALAAVPCIARGAATKPALSLGWIADPQYADIDPVRTRFYRQSLGKLGEAIEQFNGLPLDFCVNAGDTIDKKWESFDAVLKAFEPCRHRFYHLLGNHDFDLLDERKAEVPPRLGMERRYYRFSRNGFCFVMLDTNDISTYAVPAGSPEHTRATDALQKLAASGASQAQSWNGGVGPEQLRWFEETCRQAAELGERIVVFSHHPVYPPNNHNAWNAEELRALSRRNRHVAAWISGHNHAGAFGVEEDLPYVTLKGMVETKDTNAFAVASIFEDRIVIAGEGRELSRELLFRKG